MACAERAAPDRVCIEFRNRTWMTPETRTRPWASWPPTGCPMCAWTCRKATATPSRRCWPPPRPIWPWSACTAIRKSGTAKDVREWFGYRYTGAELAEWASQGARPWPRRRRRLRAVQQLLLRPRPGQRPATRRPAPCLTTPRDLRWPDPPRTHSFSGFHRAGFGRLRSVEVNCRNAHEVQGAPSTGWERLMAAAGWQARVQIGQSGVLSVVAAPDVRCRTATAHGTPGEQPQRHRRAKGETMAGPDLAAQDVIIAFGSFDCHHLVASQRAAQRSPAGKRRDDVSQSASASSRRWPACMTRPGRAGHRREAMW